MGKKVIGIIEDELLSGEFFILFTCHVSGTWLRTHSLASEMLNNVRMPVRVQNLILSGTGQTTREILPLINMARTGFQNDGLENICFHLLP